MVSVWPAAIAGFEAAEVGVAVVVVVGGWVVVVTLGAVAGVAAPLAVPVGCSEEARAVVPDGAEVVVVDVVAAVAGVDGAPPWLLWLPGLPGWAPARLLTRAVACACPPARRGVEGVVLAVATRSAISPSDTARMTHQFGRPRGTLDRKPSEESGRPPNTGPRYARVTPFALAGQTLSRSDGRQAHRRRWPRSRRA